MVGGNGSAILSGKKIETSTGAQRIALAAEVIPGQESELKSFCEKFPVELEKVTNEKEFQNCNLFLRDGHLYYYYEYVGDNIRNSLREITQADGFKNFQNQMNNYLIPKENGYWDIMDEVFHIN